MVRGIIERMADSLHFHALSIAYLSLPLAGELLIPRLQNGVFKFWICINLDRFFYVNSTEVKWHYLHIVLSHEFNSFRNR
jgi:hypothetical protein